MDPKGSIGVFSDAGMSNPVPAGEDVTEGYVKGTPRSSNYCRKVLDLAFRASCRRSSGKPEKRLRDVSDAERYTAGLQYRYGRPMP